MAQQYITIDGIKIRQPNTGMTFSFETTFGSGSKRTQTGVLYSMPMFTVEAYSYEASFLTMAEIKTILQLIAKGRHFMLHYPSAYYGEWRTAPFYVGQGNINVGGLIEGEEMFDSISFQMTGVNPI